MLPAALAAAVAAARSPPPFSGPWPLAPAPQPVTHHLASYIGRCHRSCVRQGCHGCRRHQSWSTRNSGASPTKRKCYTSGATKSGGGRCEGGAPAPPLQPRPPLYRPPPRKWGMGRGRISRPASPYSEPSSSSPCNLSCRPLRRGAGAPLGDHVLCPPRHCLRGTSRPLLNCHTPLLSPYIPESPDPGGWKGAPAPPPPAHSSAAELCSPPPPPPSPLYPLFLSTEISGCSDGSASGWRREAPLHLLPPPHGPGGGSCGTCRSTVELR